MAKKTLTLNICVNDSDITDWANAIHVEDYADELLSIPVLKRSFKQFLVDCDIKEGITENTIEAGLADWFMDYVLSGNEAKITLNIDHLY